jgi:hypothetical protein
MIVLGISIEYPEGWEVEEMPSGLVFRNFTQFCLIWGEPSTVGASKEAMQSFMNSKRGEIEVNGFNGSLVIDGISSYKIDFSDKKEPINRTAMYFIVDTTNNWYYSISCVAFETDFERYSPVFEKVANSFSILS